MQTLTQWQKDLCVLDGNKFSHCVALYLHKYSIHSQTRFLQSTLSDAQHQRFTCVYLCVRKPLRIYLRVISFRMLTIWITHIEFVTFAQRHPQSHGIAIERQGNGRGTGRENKTGNNISSA